MTLSTKSAARFFLLALVAAPLGAGAGAGELPRNWPLAPSAVEERFATQDFRILEVKGAGGGVTGASRLKVEYPDGQVLKMKWKSVPEKSLDGWNNSPRKELASYQVHRFLVDENDYFVPTLAPHCIPMDDYVAINPETKASLPGSRCVLGLIAIWLDDVDAPEDVYDKARFSNDPLYARSMADFNVFGYLVDHRDGRRGNILLANDKADPRVYPVDNGIAFGPFPWNFFVTNWNKIRVPWVRRETVDRLRNLEPAKLDALGVVSEVAMDNDRIYRVVTPGPNLDPKKGVRIGDRRVQFGLTTGEIADLRGRIADLLKKVDSGKLPVR